MKRHRDPLAVAIAIAAPATVVVAAVPAIRFAYENVSLHVALEVAEGLVAALLAGLAFGRARTTGRLDDRVLAWSFSILAATNLFLAAAPAIALEGRPVGFFAWAALGTRLLGGLGLAAAALLPARSAAGPRAHGQRWRWTPAVAVVGVAVLAVLADIALDDVLDPSLSPERSNRPLLVGHPVLLAAQAASVILYGVATLGFRRRAMLEGDPLLRWLSAGAAVGAFARVHYLLFPSLYSDWVYTGDFLRFAAYGLFLSGAVREIQAHLRAQTELASLEERQRLARDIHDGLIQELSFIRSQTAGAEQLRGPTLTHVATAADRALTELRHAVHALGSAGADPLGTALRRAAEEVAVRAGAQVAVDCSVDSLQPAARDAVLRLVREAATNAVRHGGARTVTVRAHGTSDGQHVRVVVTDDGRGFDTAAPDQGGFGLRSMRERVAALGGALVIASQPGQGTTVDATIPV